MNELLVLSALIFFIATLYSSVGQGGASGYLAAMALVGVAPEVMKPSALTLNVLVATIGLVRFSRAGYFSWSSFLPFAIGSVPFALIGGFLSLPDAWYKQLVGVILLLAAYRLFRLPEKRSEKAWLSSRRLAMAAAVACGAGIGLVSGLTGTGGGVLLTPLLLMMGWSEMKESAGITAAFVLVNSIAAIVGHLASVRTLPVEIPYWAAAAAAGALLGSSLGSRYLTATALCRALAVVVVVAGLKLLLAV